MADVRDAIEALASCANFGGDESARQTVTDYLDESRPADVEDDERDSVLDGDVAETEDERAARERDERDRHLFGPQTD